MNAEIKRLAQRLHRLERQALQAKQPTLGFSTIQDGAIQSADEDDNLLMIIGKQFDETQTAATVSGPTPPVPLQPLVTPQVGTVQIYWDGTFVDGQVAPMDFARVLAYAVPTSEFSAASPLDYAHIVGQFNSAIGGELTAALEPGVEYVIFLATWSQAGKYSAPSDLALGEVPVIDAGTPTEAPVISPAIVDVAGMPSTIMVRTEQPPEPSTMLRYEVSTDGLSWQSYPEPSRSTILVANGLPDGTPFALDTTYYFRVWATNVLGDAPAPSETVEGRLDLAAVAMVASTVVSEGVFTGFLLAGEIQVGGTNLTLSPGEGMVVRASNGTETRFPTDGTPAKFGGDAVIRRLQVEQGAELNGTSKLGGTFRLQSQVEDPERGPTIREDWWPDNRLPVDGTYHSAAGLVRNAANDGWEILCIEEETGLWGIASVLDSDFTGVVQSFTAWGVGGVSAYQGLSVVTVSGTRYHVSTSNAAISWNGVPAGTAWITFRNSAGSQTGAFPAPSGALAVRHAVGTLPDGATLVSAWGEPTVGSQTIRYQTITLGWSGSEVTAIGSPGIVRTVQDTSPWWHFVGVAVGTFDYDGSIGDRIVIVSRGGDFIVAEYDVNNAPRRTHEEWNGPDGRGHRGLAIRGTKFNTIGNNDGVIVRYEPHQTEANRTSWWSYTWRDDDTHATLPSPRTQIVARNRCIIVVEADPAPQEGDGLDHGAKQIDIYASATGVVSGSGSSVAYRQAQLPEGTRNMFGSNRPILLGTAAPAVNNFGEVAGNPGRIFSDAVDAAGVPLINLVGDGTIGADSGDVATSGTYAGTMRFVRFGNVVWVDGYTARASGSSSSNTATGIVVPVGFRPAAAVQFAAAPFWSGGGAGAIYRYRVEADGTVLVQMSGANSTFMTLNGVWFTAD